MTRKATKTVGPAAAPDWGPHYPSAGKMIGPAWQAMWDLMRDGQKHRTDELIDAGVEASGAAAKTARNLLFIPAARGWLLSSFEYDTEAKRWRSVYWINPDARYEP